MALDLTPGHGSNIGINIVGDSVGRNEISTSNAGSSETEISFDENAFSQRTRFQTEGSTRTREYEEAINRELERRRLEAEKAAAAEAAAAAGLVFDSKKVESVDSDQSKSTQTVSISHDSSRFDTSKKEGHFETKLFHPPKDVLLHSTLPPTVSVIL